MKGIDDNSIVKHRSADDLDDGYVIELNHFEVIILIEIFIFSFDFGDDEIKPLAYDLEGKPLNCGDLIAVNDENDGNIYF